MSFTRLKLLSEVPQYAQCDGVSSLGLITCACLRRHLSNVKFSVCYATTENIILQTSSGVLECVQRREKHRSGESTATSSYPLMPQTLLNEYSMCTGTGQIMADAKLKAIPLVDRNKHFMLITTGSPQLAPCWSLEGLHVPCALVRQQNG